MVNSYDGRSTSDTIAESDMAKLMQDVAQAIDRSYCAHRTRIGVYNPWEFGEYGKFGPDIHYIAELTPKKPNLLQRLLHRQPTTEQMLLRVKNNLRDNRQLSCCVDGSDDEKLTVIRESLERAVNEVLPAYNISAIKYDTQ
jgi:hypothetical protein